ncbi:MAG: MFS transporter, partial [Gaiellaceae bacterium]
GFSTASLGILAVFLSPVVGRLVDKMDLRLIVTFGFVIFAAISFLVAHATTQITFWQIFWQRLPWGIGTACFFIPLITLSLTGLPQSEIASASGLFNFIRQLSLGFGTSISVTLWDRLASFHDHRLSAVVTPYDPLVRHWLGALRDLGLTSAQASERLTHLIRQQAFMLATNDVFWLSAWVFLALSGLVWLSRPAVRARGGPVGQAEGGHAV